jgi:hypothetical protein
MSINVWIGKFLIIAADKVRAIGKGAVFVTADAMKHAQAGARELYMKWIAPRGAANRHDGDHSIAEGSDGRTASCGASNSA